MGIAGGKIESVPSGRLRIDHASNRLIVTDDSNIDKFLAGVDDDGNVVVKIAQDGIDVKVATDDQLIFNSDQNILKVFRTATVELITSASLGSLSTVSVTHGLGYNPLVIGTATVRSSGVTQQLPWSNINAGGADAGKLRYHLDVQAIDGQSITFQFLNVSLASSLTLDIHYYILQATAI